LIKDRKRILATLKRAGFKEEFGKANLSMPWNLSARYDSGSTSFPSSHTKTFVNKEKRVRYNSEWKSVSETTWMRKRDYKKQ
jgi:hypothetical protein